MKQQDGQVMSGNSLDELFRKAKAIGQEVDHQGYDVLDNIYRRGLAAARDTVLADLIINRYTGLRSAVIIGHPYPIILIHALLKYYPDIIITVMSNSCSFVTPRDYTARLFGGQQISVLMKNPIFNSPPQGADLYILPETEFLVPMRMLPYKIDGRVVLCNCVYAIYHHTPTARMELATDLDLFRENMEPYGDYFEQRLIEKQSTVQRMFMGYSQ